MPDRYTALSYLGLVVVSAVLFYAGLRIGDRRRARGERVAVKGIQGLQAEVASLLALLLAFTVAGAQARLDARRMLIVDEANAIQTAYYRLDLVPEPARTRLQQRVRAYLHSRIESYRRFPDLGAVRAQDANTRRLESALWVDAIEACRGLEDMTPMMVLPAIGQMFDMATTRVMVRQLHPPATIFAMLVLLIFAKTVYAGVTMGARGTRSRVHILGVVLLDALVFSVILDLEFPRRGLLREDAFDQALVELETALGPR